MSGWQRRDLDIIPQRARAELVRRLELTWQWGTGCTMTILVGARMP